MEGVISGLYTGPFYLDNLHSFWGSLYKGPYYFLIKVAASEMEKNYFRTVCGDKHISNNLLVVPGVKEYSINDSNDSAFNCVQLRAKIRKISFGTLEVFLILFSFPYFTCPIPLRCSEVYLSFIICF